MSNGYRANAAYNCPDCRPDTRLVQIAPNVWSLEVLHDATCPNYAAMTKHEGKG